MRGTLMRAVLSKKRGSRYQATTSRKRAAGAARRGLAGQDKPKAPGNNLAGLQAKMRSMGVQKEDMKATGVDKGTIERSPGEVAFSKATYGAPGNHVLDGGRSTLTADSGFGGSGKIGPMQTAGPSGELQSTAPRTTIDRGVRATESFNPVKAGAGTGLSAVLKRAKRRGTGSRYR